MNSREALNTLKQHEKDLRALGISHAGIFGSVARGENRPDSDLDILIDTDPNVRITVYDYVGLKEYVAGLFKGSVDVVRREGLKPHLRSAATAEAVYAF